MICEKIGCRPEEIDDLIMALQPPVSYEEYLEEVLRDDPAGEFFCDNYPWAEYVSELDMFDGVANSEVKRMIKEALEKLTPKANACRSFSPGKMSLLPAPNNVPATDNV